MPHPFFEFFFKMWEKSCPPTLKVFFLFAVTYSVPHNCVVQIYDYKSRKPRIVFGPDMVKLGPEEEFTMLHLSGGRPKKAGAQALSQAQPSWTPYSSRLSNEQWLFHFAYFLEMQYPVKPT